MAEWLTCIDIADPSGPFAIGRADGTVVLAEMSMGQPLRVEQPHEGRVSAVVFDGALLWTCGFDGAVRLYDTAPSVSPARVAWHGREAPGGWEE